MCFAYRLIRIAQIQEKEGQNHRVLGRGGSRTAHAVIIEPILVHSRRNYPTDISNREGLRCLVETRVLSPAGRFANRPYQKPDCFWPSFSWICARRIIYKP